MIVRSLIAAAGLAAACHQSPSYTWHCPDGSDVVARYASDSEFVHLREGTATLPHAMSASGARYANDTLEVWEHAGEVRVSLRDSVIHEHCRRPS